MSVYKPKASPYYHFDFWVGGVRFAGSTGRSEKTKAREVERLERAKAKVEAESRKADATAPMTIGGAVPRYMAEVGYHHAAVDTTITNLDRLVAFFGVGHRLEDITDNDIPRLVAWRRGQTVRGRSGKKAKVIVPATVNRSTIEPLQKLMNRAAMTWKVPLPRMPDWKRHMLKEPAARVREVRASEEQALDAIRSDYRPLIDFARESGLRLAECLMPKTAVDLAGGWVRVIGKGKKPIKQPITSEMRTILIAAMDNPTDAVFT